MVDSQTFDPSLLLSKLHTGGDFEAFDDLVLAGKFDQKRWSVGSGDVELSDYVRHVEENMTKIDSIHEAVRKGDIREVKNLIDLKKLIAAPGRDGRNALCLAISLGQIEIAKYLLESYPKCINQTDKDGRTAMHYAAAMEDPCIYDLLKAKAGDETLEDEAGHTPLFYKDHPNELLDGQ